MKVKFIFIIILCSSLYTFGNDNLSYPVDFFFEDAESGYKILLGSYYKFLENQYYDLQSEDLIFESNEPKYQIWKVILNSGLEYNFSSYSKIITLLRVTKTDYITSRGISVGDSVSNVVESYGEPSLSYRNKANQLCLQYESIQKEINLDGRMTILEFKFNSGQLVEIVMEIHSWV